VGEVERQKLALEAQLTYLYAQTEKYAAAVVQCCLSDNEFPDKHSTMYPDFPGASASLRMRLDIFQSVEGMH
jgi:hypothetical protein